MKEDDWRWVRAFTPFMDERDFLAVDFSFELCKLIQFCFLFAPIVLILPVIGKFLHVAQVGAVIPTHILDLSRPACAHQAVA